VLVALLCAITIESVRAALASEAFYLSSKGGFPQYADDAKVLYDQAANGTTPALTAWS
jgi:hypothetical protein